MEKIKKVKDVIMFVFWLGVMIFIILTMAGKTNGFFEWLSSNSSMLRGNDTGATIADNRKETIGGEPVSGNSNEVEAETITETAEVVAEVEPESVSSEQPTSLDDIFDMSAEETEEDAWWAEDRVFAWVDTETGDEIDVTLHWITEDLGEIRIDMSDGSSTGACSFKTDAMWSFFTYNGQEAQFYLDEVDGVEELHLLLGEIGEQEEIIMKDLEWIQQNAG